MSTELEPASREDLDEQVIAELRGGKNQEESFHHLVTRYYRALFHFFRHRGLAEEDCRDLTQETFLSVFEGVGRFRGEAPFEAWLFQIAGNRLSSYWRRRHAARRQGVEIPLETPGPDGSPIEVRPIVVTGDDPLTLALARERRNLLRAAIAELPPRMRRCAFLRYHQGRKYREIATLLRISVDTVKPQLAEARRRLQERLGACFDVPEP